MHANPAQADSGSAHEVLRQWLRRQYSSYITTLLSLVRSPQQSASIQVAAATAVMEAVRCEGGVGVFADGLYNKLLSAVATAPGVKPEVG